MVRAIPGPFPDSETTFKESTMSEEVNVQVVRDAYAAFQRGDIQNVLDSLADDVEWVSVPVEPLAGTYRGPGEVASFFQKVGENFEFSRFEPQEFVAQGDRVVVLGHYTATVRSTGRELDSDWAMAFTLSDGKVSRFQEYNDTAAVAAAFQTTSAAAA